MRHNPQNANRLIMGAALMVALLMFSLYLFTAPTGLTWQHDEGDLAAAAFTGGNPHPHGYPTYMLAARLAIAVQGGDVAVRIARFSALCGAIAAALVTLFAYRILKRIRSRISSNWLVAASALAGLGYGTVPLVWTQAILVEMYAFASIFSIILLLLGETIAHRLVTDKLDVRYFILFGLIFGFGLGAHVTIGFAVLAIGIPILAGLLFSHGSLWQKTQWIIIGLIGVLIGVCIFVMIPLSANRSPTSNWGNPSTWEGFIWMVTAAAYRGQIVLRLSLEKWLYLISMTAQQFSIPIILIAAGGFWVLWERYRTFALGSALAIIFSIQFLTMYDVTNVFAYLLPAYALISVMLAVGTFAMVDRVLVQITTDRQRLALGLSTLVLGWLVLNTGIRVPSVSLRENQDAQNYITGSVEVIPRGAFIFSATDQTTFALWYAQAVQHPEKQWMVIEARMLDQKWYRETLARFNPSIASDSWSLPLPDLIARLYATGSPIYTTFDPNEYAISGTPAPPFYVVSTKKQNK